MNPLPACLPPDRLAAAHAAEDAAEDFAGEGAAGGAEDGFGSGLDGGFAGASSRGAGAGGLAVEAGLFLRPGGGGLLGFLRSRGLGLRASFGEFGLGGGLVRLA